MNRFFICTRRAKVEIPNRKKANRNQITSKAKSIQNNPDQPQGGSFRCLHSFEIGACLSFGI
ncbi:MAG: hypothetical protein WD768_06640 [Phycisphaeraceae bacterium]